jgi:hypothetical protein
MVSASHDPMTVRRDDSIKTALQYLTWALEEIEKTGDQEAARHVRIAFEALRASRRNKKTAAVGLMRNGGRRPDY